MNDHFDVIIVGLGGHGSATLAYIAKHHPELRVLGIEQFSVTHKNGSSHGKSRIYRQAYFEHPSYVPLLQRSLELWEALQSFHIEKYPNSVHRPLELCGGVMIGTPSSEVIKGTLASIQLHNLPHEILSSSQMKEKYPVFNLSEEEIAIWENNAGYLHPELCIESYIAQAEQHGANIHYNERLVSYQALDATLAESVGMKLTVVTNERKYFCQKLILTVGAWANEIYGNSLPPSFPLTIQRRVLYWFAPSDPDNDIIRKHFKDMPIYIWEFGQEGDNFYGFPEQTGYEGSIKVALHSERDESMLVASPATVNRHVSEDEVELMRKLLREKIPWLNGELKQSETCMYTMTRDQHFLIDFHPTVQNVVIASPCSGHGFKFCSVIGEILAQLTVTGNTVHNIDLFRINSRKALT